MNSTTLAQILALAVNTKDINRANAIGVHWQQTKGIPNPYKDPEYELKSSVEYSAGMIDKYLNLYKAVWIMKVSFSLATVSEPGGIVK